MNASLLKTHAGFTLIEVMVALFILTIGMLGSTSMMLRSQQKAQETNTEANAAQSVWNIAELLRSNITDVNAGAFDNFEIRGEGPPSPPTCLATGCSDAGLLTMVTYFVQLELEAYLKNKNNAIVNISLYTGTPSPDGPTPEPAPEPGAAEPTGEEKQILFKIALAWNEIDKEGQAYPKNYQMIFQP
ncbi:hypothetical protein MNBD_GAMMA11-1309 [hydrothermal vent metagenome]|uniref:Type IV fimbrial biogenesis protein PilV n=1 Tax=hydrothermal vent metagenome TaxID=652676 RepID=A0A3B0X801_9ZZZZ